MSLSDSLNRADKLLSEANSRSLGEAWRERQGRTRVYVGPLAAAKCVPRHARERLLGALNQEGFTRLAAGSQQIVLVPDTDINTVLKIDRDSLGSKDSAQRRAEIEHMTQTTLATVGSEFMPPFEVATTANPMRYGSAVVACVHQGRVFNARDVFQLDAGERALLPEGVKERLITLGNRLTDALDTGEELLPELIGRNNLVIGSLASSSPDVWLIDNFTTERSKLESTCGPLAGVPDIDVYHQRVSALLGETT